MTDSALFMPKTIDFQAFFAAAMDACSGRKRGSLPTDLMRNPSVCSEESIGFYNGKQWFPREKPMVYSVETAGFAWGARHIRHPICCIRRSICHICHHICHLATHCIPVA